MAEASRFRVRLDELEQSAHVRPDQMVESQPDDQHPEYVAPEDLDRLRLLNDPAGAGRLKVR